MYGVVKIGNVDVPMLAMGSIDIYYRNIFHEDPAKIQSRNDLDPVDWIRFYQRMGFVMAKFAECKSRKEMAKLNEDSFIDWAETFERGDLFDAVTEIQAVYEEQAVPAVDAKKNTDEPSE